MIITYTRMNIARHLDRLHALNPVYAVRWPRRSTRLGRPKSPSITFSHIGGSL